MSDRELLELAAKAAGIEWYGYFGDDTCECQYLDIGPNDVVPWNPLADDGDAMRLAATCHMVLDWSGSELHVRFWLTQSPEAPTLTFKSSDCGGDKATIVRAAAEIGRTAP